MTDTVTNYLNSARYALGSIEVKHNGYSCTPNASWTGNVFIDSPAEPHRPLIQALWKLASEHALFGGGAVLWIGHDFAQLAWLHQSATLTYGRPCPGPISWPIVIASRRAADTGACYYCLLGGEEEQRRRFRKRFERRGSFSEPTHLPDRGRNLAREILLALRTRGPMSKRAIARVVQARKLEVGHVVDQLAAAGHIRRGDGWSWTCHAQMSPQTGDSHGS